MNNNPQSPTIWDCAVRCYGMYCIICNIIILLSFSPMYFHLYETPKIGVPQIILLCGIICGMCIILVQRWSAWLGLFYAILSFFGGIWLSIPQHCNCSIHTEPLYWAIPHGVAIVLIAIWLWKSRTTQPSPIADKLMVFLGAVLLLISAATAEASGFFRMLAREGIDIVLTPDFVFILWTFAGLIIGLGMCCRSRSFGILGAFWSFGSALLLTLISILCLPDIEPVMIVFDIVLIVMGILMVVRLRHPPLQHDGVAEGGEEGV